MTDFETKVSAKCEKVDLDRILVELRCGRYQARLLALSALVAAFTGWVVQGYLFLAARIPTRCYIPGCDSKDTPFSPEWLQSAIPMSGEAIDNCRRYGNTSALPEDGTCPKHLFNTSMLLFCDSYVYENINTIVYDFGLACDEWRRSLVGSVHICGTLLGLPFTGYMSDRWGRRTAIMFAAVNVIWLGVVRYWVDTYSGFLILEFAGTTFGSGGFSTAYIMAMEIMGPKYRVAVGALMHTFFAVGEGLLGLLAWLVPHWRNLVLTIYIPQLLALSYPWLISESVRWYMSKGRYTESEAVLQRIAEINNRELSRKSRDALRFTAEEEKKKKEMEKHEKSEWLIVLVFRHKRVRVRCLVSPVWWITTTFVYYGLSINAVNMSGNRYLNFLLVSAIEIPGYWGAVLLVNRVGRKPVLCGAYWVCAVCQLACIFVPKDMYSAMLGVFLVAKTSIAMAATTLYVYTGELYPTRHRHSLFAFSSMTGRIGSAVAPLTPAFAAATFEDMPFALFGVLALVAGLLVQLTPETLGAAMPDTMEEVDDFTTKL